jgi:endonuclease III
MMSTDVSGSKKARKALEGMRKSVSFKTALSNIRDKAEDPFRILVSTILSARTRDPVTEKVSDLLFKEYPDVHSLSRARYASVARIIRPVNFYKGKTKKIIAASIEIVSKFNGVVPNNYDELLELPGVGRKTAGCVLVYGFNLPAIPVDVHVHRISNRIGIVKTKNPEETEKQLLELYGKEDWLAVNELFVAFGQSVCLPRNPKCSVCPLRSICDYYSMRNSQVCANVPSSKVRRSRIDHDKVVIS